MNKFIASTIFISIVISSGVFCEKMSKKAFKFSQFKLESESPVSAAYLNHPITEKDRIKVSADGHLQADGKRIRIFGTNLSAFPKDHKQADFYAKLLANQGYNCIRFHHTDASWTNCFLKRNGNGKWVLNQKRLDDFDYFFAALKQNGIYSNINFLTGRDISSADGYLSEINKVSDWKSRHCLGFWNEEAMKKQQEWAATLMNHINPYTKIAYKDDPAAAIVEINNENGLVMGYLTGWLEDYSENYWQELEDKWNDWLLQKGLDYADLENQFNFYLPFTQTLAGKNSKWHLEQHEDAKATLQKNENSVQIKVTHNGSENWHIQYNCPGLAFENSKCYTISFSAKSSKPQTINVSLMEAHTPWQNAGWSSNIKIGTDWSNFTFTVQNIKTDDNLRLNFGNMGFSAGTSFNLKDITIKEGGNIVCIKTGKKSTEEHKTVLLPHFEEYKTLPDAYKNLILNFLYDTEEKYWICMKNFISETLGTKALVMGTIIGCSTPSLQSCFDIIDTHAYWNHPIFPSVSWDMNDYYVNNKTLLKANGDNTLFNLAKNRVYGKPFSVSEYDHPYPNQFSAEMYPMYASFASFQDWDCIYTFCSELPDVSGTSGDATKINGYFDQTSNPAKSCAAPFAAKIFRQNLVSAAKTKIYVNLSKVEEIKNLYKFSGWSVGNANVFGSVPEMAGFYQLGINLKDVTPADFTGAENCVEISNIGEKSENGFYFSKSKGVSDDDKTFAGFISADSKKIKGFDETNQLYWDETSGVYIVCNDKVTVAVLSENAVLPENSKMSEIWKNNLIPGKNEGFSSFAAIKDLKYTKDYSDKIANATNKSDEINKLPYLIFACSWSGNNNEGLKEYGSKGKNGAAIIQDECKITTISTLGQGPAMVLSSNFDFTLNGNHSLYKADTKGNKAKKLEQNQNNFTISADSGTLWYVLE